jgi:hypothetical protein
VPCRLAGRMAKDDELDTSESVDEDAGRVRCDGRLIFLGKKDFHEGTRAWGLSRGEKYCHNGGMAFAPEQAAAGSGSKKVIIAPSGGPSKAAVCREKARRVRGPRPLGQQWTRLHLPQTGEVLPERGHGLRPPIEASASQGSKMAMMAPVAVPRKLSICREKGLGSMIRALWGPEWTRLPFSRSRQVLPERGHGLAGRL